MITKALWASRRATTSFRTRCHFCRLLIGSRFLFLLNAKPINPSTTKTAPATIIQCGYSSSKSKRSIQVKPVILKQALDFKQLGHDRVACHRGMVDDSSAARANGGDLPLRDPR